MSETIENNKLVTITYSIKNQLGETVEQNDLPVSYVHGSGSELLPVLERHLGGHKAGDNVEVSVTPAEGFGEHDPNISFTDDIENVPAEYRQIGVQAEFQNEDGERKVFTVSRVDENTVTLDGNHPLAGQNLTFVVNIKDVRDATSEEIAQRQFENYDEDTLNTDPSRAH
jgi:FKBP-type peptidyl-prolyl cis-trans isomerase SlyD